MSIDKLTPDTELVSSVPPERWDDWREFDAKQWPRRVEKAYQLVPTLCFNCEAGCGLVAWIDKDSGEVRKFEGNPLHPGSRGRNCAKGPATINQNIAPGPPIETITATIAILPIPTVPETAAVRA